MKRTVAIAVVAAALALSSTANAKDMTGRFGIGADTTLGFATSSHGGVGSESTFSIPGISIVYQSSKIFAIQLIFGVFRVSSSEMDVDQSQTDMLIAGRAIYQLLHTSNTSVGVVGGLAINRQSYSFGDMSDSATHLAFEVGIRPEWFISEWLSFHTQVGIAITLLNEDSPFAEGGTNINVVGNANLLGNAGFTFYF